MIVQYIGPLENQWHSVKNFECVIFRLCERSEAIQFDLCKRNGSGLLHCVRKDDNFFLTECLCLENPPQPPFKKGGAGNSARFYTILLFFLALSANASTHKPMDFLKKIQGQPDEGQQIVAHYCMMCHAPNPQIQLGAPRIANTGDWAIRLKQGIDKLMANTRNGVRAMPPRGGCFECSDEQLKKAVQVMLPREKKRK